MFLFGRRQNYSQLLFFSVVPMGTLGVNMDNEVCYMGGHLLYGALSW